ncbi:MAG: hypothetical protein HYR55_18430 [Acidobacteria bacterium]|nr:hypothetical protein [Acidobacteriota bacterium]MBI3655146.1 hypothetical protein [Acidobacteriota bacterium]
MSRKYGQKGYMSGSEETKPRPIKKASDGARTVRSPTMPGFREVFRCALCGTSIRVQIGVTEESQCPKCKSDLHSCKNCLHFDPSRHLECTQAIPARIVKKDLRNACALFTVRKSVEKEASESLSKIEDARAAFDRLFRK